MQTTRLNPYAAEKLSPQHLELLFPATFYKSDEDLSLHLSESCLVETLAWEGDKAVDETAFWLKVLSTPQTDYLKQQKKLFKFAIAERCKDIYNNYNSPGANVNQAVITIGAKPKETKAQKENQAKAVIKFTTNETGQHVGVLTTEPDPEPSAVDQMYTDNEWDLIEKHLSTGAAATTTSAASANTPQQPVDLGSATPGFGIKTYKCKLCDFAADNRQALNKHQKVSHAEELPFSCDRCDYTSKYAWSIKTHIDSVHLKTKRFQCPLCDYATSQACFLKRHTIRRHNPDKGAHKCPYCDYAAHHPNSLQRHVNRQHTQNFSHKCPYCDFGRDCKYLVEDHINDVHLKKVIYQCSECSFQTYKQRALKSHHKTHLNKSVMQCSECEFKSVTVSGLTRHMKAEHPDKDPKATIAGTRGKKSVSSVVQHDGDEYTAVVMGKCKYCDFAHENLLKLKAHLRRAHKKNSVQCPHCNFSAATKNSLTKHISNKHPDVPKPGDEETADTVDEGDEVTNDTIDETQTMIVQETGGSEIVEAGATDSTLPTVQLVEGLDGIIVVQTGQ